MIDFSVAMCTYNGAKYLNAQLESIANQSLPARELIVCDDGSNDSTVDLVRDFTESHADLNAKLYVNERNLHFSGNFFKAASLCSGSYVVFSDQDDEWYREKLRKAADLIAIHSPELLIHRANIRDMNSDAECEAHAVPSMDQPIYHQRLVRCVRSYSLGCCFVVSKSLIDLFPPFWTWDEYLQHREEHGAFVGHDMLIFSAAWARRSVLAVDDRLMDYRIHGGNIFGRRPEQARRRLWSQDKSMLFSACPDTLATHAQRLLSEHRLLVRIAKEMDATVSHGISALSDALQRRGELLMIRAEIHSSKKSRADRAKAFIRNAILGNYFLGTQFFGVSRGTIFKDFAAVLAVR